MARSFISRTFPQKFRSYKWDLRLNFLKDKATVQDMIDACPYGMNVDVWARFVNNENQPGMQDKYRKYAENQRKTETRHCLGRLSYAVKSNRLVSTSIIV